MNMDPTDPQGALAVPHPLASAALADPERAALCWRGQRWSAAALLELVRRRAEALQAAGLRPGQRVARLARPGLDFVVDLHALGWLGASLAPLSVEAPVESLADALQAVSPRWWLDTGDAALQEAARRAQVAPLLPQGQAEPAPERFWPLAEERLVVTTSGTTGAPRPVPLYTSQLVMSAFGSLVRLGHQHEDRWLCCLPLNHVGGLSVLLRSAFYGITAVLHDGFNPQEVARAMEEGEVTVVSLVPQMLRRVLDVRAEAAFPASLRVVLLGGGAAPEALLTRCQRLQIPVATTWGMTEAASQISTMRPGAWPQPLDSGAPLPMARVRRHESGALEVRGPLVGGALLTGDQGEVTATGRVRIHGRGDDVIISGGENIDPHQVERALEGHLAVAQAAVVGRPDLRWGHRPVAALVPAEGAPRPSLEELRQWCRACLPAWMAPDEIRWVEALPRTQLGKLSRASVRAWWLDTATQVQETSERERGAQSAALLEERGSHEE